MKLTFEINGRRVRPGDVGDAFEATILKAIEENVRSKLAGVRDPETGEFPVVAARGSDLDNLSFEIGGSPQLIALAKQRLEAREDGMQEEESAAMTSSSPYAFVCHSSEDNALARRLASDFRRQGIDAFFDEWEIGPGDSLRQKIDEGLGRCTHFIALLTPSSITKSWVNAEIDAGFVANSVLTKSVLDDSFGRHLIAGVNDVVGSPGSPSV